ncbi:Por secretion system C-terminal sorting domain [Chryseobacterium nakagawai]|uniref:T9SS C-terminal target domain-containing protein n=1 Tax=Chryseobacterium nakagawai TaxID=1241982 RepID=A0AAD0YIA9_CHRNA|nr:choice-of-anchor J domain-containing protein [Chryseobacterium nakagawai]AZA89534.1 T9SS C-terminal target domain-containing protein [Chryseobacterium nakagawai]VEH20905.1 Por secretion system C-terminal sorting domain [Chryseobacterium nakagawai]
MNKILLIGAVVLGIQISAQCNPLNLPYTEDFESVTTPALPACSTIENAGSGNDWTTRQSAFTGIDSKALTYKYHSSNDANAWFFTPGLNLMSGVEYKLTYTYSGSGFDEKLKVAYGMNANSSSMTNQLADYPDIADEDIHTETVTFIPQTTGVYYMGFNCYSDADQFYLQVDDISVTTSQLSTSEVTNRNNGVKIYPNPFTEVISINKIENVRSISITDISGKLIKTFDKPSSDLYVKEIGSGIYMLKLEMKDGSQKVIKIIKK